jgi:hypothetical protein
VIVTPPVGKSPSYTTTNACAGPAGRIVRTSRGVANVIDLTSGSA